MTAQPTKTHTNRAPLRALALALLALLLWCAAASAYAGATITGVTINGQSSATVLPGSTITVRIDVNFTAGTRWRRTKISTSPASSLVDCIDHGDSDSNGDWYFEFDTVAPDTQGTFDFIVEVQSNNNCSSGPAAARSFADAIITDATFPVVTSIVRADASPTNASPVRWTVTFNRPVTGVSLPDFALARAGITGTPTLSGPTGSGAVYTITSTTGAGSGTLGLNLVDNDSITGSNGARLGGTGTGTSAGSGNFTGEVYVIDRLAPTIPSAGILANGVSLVFARVGDTVSVVFTTADANAVQTPVATIGGVAATVTGSGSNWTASRVMTAADAEGLVGFALNVTDAAGNAAVARTTVTDGSSVTLDKTAPVASISCNNPALCGVANPTAATQVRWNVNFSEAVSGLGTANFALSGAAAAGSSIVSVSGSGSAYTVLANAVGPGVLGLNLSANLAFVRDRAGNNPPANNAVAGNSYTLAGCVVVAGGACTFDAVETGAAAKSAIFTKRTGAVVTLDIVALNGAAINTTATDTVVATLVEATNDAACGTVALADPVTITFVAANNGRRNVPFTPKRAASNARVKLVSNGVTACSTDNFALRPDAFTISGTGVGADSANGAAFAATPVIKAAKDLFAMQAASVAGYDGTPVYNKLRLQAGAGAVVGDLGGAFGQAGATGVSAGAAFTYSEVGYFRFQSFSLYDNTFASVDSVKGECLPHAALGGAGAPSDPNIAVGGKFGCYFGNPQSSYFGRFIPDHFALSSGSITDRSAIATCAAATFTYMGEKMQPTFVLTARNGLNATTVNYVGDFARLAIATQLSFGAIDDPVAPGVRRPLAECAATPTAPCLTVETPSGAFTAGVSDAIVAPMTVTRIGTTAPLTAFKIGVAPIDTDGVRIATYNLDTVNVVAGTAQRALVGETIVRYGRLQIDNAYGSELLNLSMKIRAQYWTGSGYATNTLDSCTPVPPAAFTMEAGAYKGGITAGNMNIANVTGGPALVAGVGKVVLSKPTPAPTVKGSAVLKSNNVNLPGSGRATFGVYKASPVIYVRETY